MVKPIGEVARGRPAARETVAVQEQPVARRALVVIGLALLIGAVVLALPLTGITQWGHRVLAIIAVALVLWIGEALNIAVTSILVILLLAMFGPGPSDQATRAALYGFQLPAGYFLLATLVVAAATVRSGLAARLAHALIAASRGHARRTYLELLAFIPPFALVIPSATTRNAILIPAYEHLYERLGIRRGQRLAKLISLGMGTLNAVGSIAVLTGGVAPITAAFLLGGLSWGQWFTYMAVPTYVILFASGLLYLLWLRPGPIKQPTSAREEPRSVPGSWTSAEIRTALIIVTMTALWLTDTWTGWDPLIPAFLGAVALLTPGFGVVSWKDFEATSPWGMFFVTGSALSIAHALETSGAAKWLAIELLSLTSLENLSLAISLPLLMIFVVMPVNVVLPNRAGVLGILIPLLTSVAHQIGVNPLTLGLMTALIAQTSTFYPVQNAATLLVYQTRHFSQFDVFRAGLILFAVSTVAVFAVAIPWWALVGLPLHS